MERIELVKEALSANNIELFDNRFIDSNELLTVAFDDNDSINDVKIASGDYDIFYTQLGYDNVLLLHENIDLEELFESL